MIQAGAGLELRPVCPQDAEIWFAVIERNLARLREWLPWAGQDFTFDTLRRFLTERERDNAERASLTTGIWHEDALIGSIGLHKIDKWHRSTSIGYWLDAAEEGKGLMSRACRAIVSEAFRNYGMHRIEIRCATANLRSSAIPRRLGFSEEGVLREAEWLHDHYADLRVFSMLEQDWNSPGE